MAQGLLDTGVHNSARRLGLMMQIWESCFLLTVTKAMEVEENFLQENGKMGTQGGLHGTLTKKKNSNI